MKTVLVVDDEFDLLHSICAILESEGYGVLHAGNGRAALELLQRSGKPDLVITDFMMPYLSGQEFLEKMYALPQFKTVPSVLMSGVGERQGDGQARWSLFLQKPFTLDRLLEAVEQLIGKPENAMP